MKASGKKVLQLSAAMMVGLVSACAVSPEPDQLRWSDLKGTFFKLEVGSFATMDGSTSENYILRKDSLVIEKFEPRESQGRWKVDLVRQKKYELSEADSKKLWELVLSTEITGWKDYYESAPEILGGGYWESTYIADGRIYESRGSNHYPAEGGSVYIGSDKRDYIELLLSAFNDFSKVKDQSSE